MTIFELFELLGNLGEFVGAVAVVATLVFVGIQVRQSTREWQRVTNSLVLRLWMRHFVNLVSFDG